MRAAQLVTALLGALLVTASGGCATATAGCRSGCGSAPPAQPPEYPGVLRPPSALAGNFLRRQRLVATHGGQTHSFEAVLQKRGDTLTLVGLTPFGTKAFVLQQQGLEVSFTSFMPGELPFPPRYILLDIQRVYATGPAGAPRADGDHELIDGADRLREQWSGGRLLRRDYTNAALPGVLTITYAEGMRGEVSCAHIAIDNGWVGYHLDVETVEEQAL